MGGGSWESGTEEEREKKREGEGERFSFAVHPRLNDASLASPDR